MLVQRLRDRFPAAVVTVAEPRGEITLEAAGPEWLATCRALRDEFGFEQLTAVSGVDYMGYGSDEWDTEGVSSGGFSRGVEGQGAGRFAWGEQPSQEDDGRIVPVEMKRWCQESASLSSDGECLP